MKTVRIGTRRSQLALWQANHVKSRLQAAHDGLKVELVEIVSEGDKTLDIPLSRVGGKGMFLKELEVALVKGEIDLAVHSMKDVTVTLPDGLHIAVYCTRENPLDALVSNDFSSLADMPEGSLVGTCSLRRQCQIRAAFPHLELVNLRGNVNTRLARLDEGRFSGIILAAAGLIRLEMQERIAQMLDPGICLPAGGQGVVGIESRIDDDRINQLIAPLNDQVAETEVLAERAANAALAGGCHVPVALFAEATGSVLSMRGLVGSLDGTKLLQSGRSGRPEEPEALGNEIAGDLLDQGAGDILKEVYAAP